MIKISVIGLGFVGLTTAVGLRHQGFDVIGYDNDQARSEAIRQGIVPFHEPALIEYMKLSPIQVAQTMDEATQGAEVIFLCVGTPQGEDGKVDLSQIEGVLSGLKAKPEALVVIKSTVPPGTTKGLKSQYALANNPEFLREGHAWEDFMMPDRIVCGVSDARSQALLAQIYAPFHAPVHFTSLNTAEFIKYLSNATLATAISFSNEMAHLADNIGDIQVAKAFKILHEDSRFSGSGIASYFYPGAGYGGYCLPKDTQALSALAKERRIPTRVLDAVIRVNDTRPAQCVEKIKKRCPDPKTGITILGLSFKPESDDVRASTSAKLIQGLLEAGYTQLNAYDPLSMNGFQQMYEFNIEYSPRLQAVVIIATGWEAFKTLDLSDKYVIDLRYLLEA